MDESSRPVEEIIEQALELLGEAFTTADKKYPSTLNREQLHRYMENVMAAMVEVSMNQFGEMVPLVLILPETTHTGGSVMSNLGSQEEMTRAVARSLVSWLQLTDNAQSEHTNTIRKKIVVPDKETH